MTTNMRFDLVEDLSHPNDILCPRIRADLDVAGAVWTAPVNWQHASEDRLDCIRYVLGRLAARWPDWGVWVVAGQGEFYTSSRISMHYGIWRTFQIAGFPVSGRESIIEVLQQAGEQVRFFGAIRLDIDHLNAAHTMMREHSAVLIMVDETEAQETIAEVLKQGWARYGTNPPEEVLEIVSPRGGLVIAEYGGFGEPDTVVAAIGRRELVAEIEP